MLVAGGHGVLSSLLFALYKVSSRNNGAAILFKFLSADDDVQVLLCWRCVRIQRNDVKPLLRCGNSPHEESLWNNKSVSVQADVMSPLCSHSQQNPREQRVLQDADGRAGAVVHKH